MTRDEPLPEMDAPGCEPPGYRTVDALLDGEAVDKDALRAALAEAGARDYLVDALLLRQLAHEAGPSRFVMPATPRGGLYRGMRWLAASLILIAGTAGGYTYGLRAQVPTSGSSSVQVLLDNPPPVAPQPTQVIHFEPGVNWTRSNGSH